MTTFAAIADSDVDPESPGTTTLFTRLRDNPLAIQEGDATAPKLQTAAYATASVDQAAIGPNVVGQSEIKESSAEYSTNSTSAVFFTLSGGAYGFGLQLKTSTVSDAATHSSLRSVSTSYITQASLQTTSTIAYLKETYITASRPYDLGDGEIPLFVFAQIDKTTKDIISVYAAPEAPWHYNGPTDIRGKLWKDGKKYRERKDLSSLPFTYASAKADPVKLREYHAAFNEAPIVYEEITQAIKNADMPLIPRPMESSASTEVIMLSPMSPLMVEFAEMMQHDEFSLNELLHEGRFAINSTALNLSTPPGVGAFDFKWK